MARSILIEAASLLAFHYGELSPFGPAREWPTLVRAVLEQGRPPKKECDWSWLAEGPLASARETAACEISQLAELSETHGQPASKAPVLRSLAHWWERHADGEPSPRFESRSVEAWQAGLRAIRGVGRELADRILLFAGGLSVYPLDRASLRIAARHGWMEVAAEYEEWQTFFVHSTRAEEIDLTQLSLWSARIGREFCRSRIDCDACPLRSLLPARGPVPLDTE